jgi:hypothetical protein
MHVFIPVARCCRFCLQCLVELILFGIRAVCAGAARAGGRVGTWTAQTLSLTSPPPPLPTSHFISLLHVERARRRWRSFNNTKATALLFSSREAGESVFPDATARLAHPTRSVPRRCLSISRHSMWKHRGAKIERRGSDSRRGRRGARGAAGPDARAEVAREMPRDKDHNYTIDSLCKKERRRVGMYPLCRYSQSLYPVKRRGKISCFGSATFYSARRQPPSAKTHKKHYEEELSGGS